MKAKELWISLDEGNRTMLGCHVNYICLFFFCFQGNFQFGEISWVGGKKENERGRRTVNGFSWEEATGTVSAILKLTPSKVLFCSSLSILIFLIWAPQFSICFFMRANISSFFSFDSNPNVCSSSLSGCVKENAFSVTIFGKYFCLILQKKKK